MSSWSSYPSIFTLGHRAIKDLLNFDVTVEEKVDGSQFSFGLVPTHQNDDGNAVDAVYTEIDGVDYSLKIRSKGCVMNIVAPEKMFNAAATTVRDLADKLHPGWTYRGEYLAKPSHNALAYDRVPTGHIIIFDINTGNQEYLDYPSKRAEADRLGLETVPLIFSGRVKSVESVREFLGRVSILGGQNIEGVVIKPIGYNLYGTDKKCLLGKFVSEAFKEVHRKSWGTSNPSVTNIMDTIAKNYGTQARWNKAIQHLREAGRLVDDLQDIGPIIKEIPADILSECESDIKDALFNYAWPHIKRGLTAGFPQYYKDLILKRAFEADANDLASPPTTIDPTTIDSPSNIAPEQESTIAEPVDPSPSVSPNPPE